MINVYNYRTILRINRFYRTVSIYDFHQSGPGQGSPHNDSLQNKQSGIRKQVGEKDFIFFRAVQIGPGAHPATSRMGTAAPSRGYRAWRLALTNNSSQLPRLKMGRTVPLAPLGSCNGTLQADLYLYQHFQVYILQFLNSTHVRVKTVTVKR